MADGNGAIEIPADGLHGITIIWDEKAQVIKDVQFDPLVFRSFGMVLSVLRLAFDSVEIQRKALQVENLQKQMQEKMAAAQLNQQLFGRR